MKRFSEWAGKGCLMALALALYVCLAYTAVWAKTSDDPASPQTDEEYVEICSEWTDMDAEKRQIYEVDRPYRASSLCAEFLLCAGGGVG